jgi:polypyrimidine tract-binding protein 1
MVIFLYFKNNYFSKNAMDYLNGCPLNERALAVAQSNFTTVSVQGKSEKKDGKVLAKDYTGSPLHRYRVVGSKNYNHICPPSSLLHVSNIPQQGTESYLKDLFSKHGKLLAFKFFVPRNDKKMALVQMDSVQSAVEALVHLHDHRIGESNLRVSFSKNAIKK